MRISVFGLGYVGVTGVGCLAKLGHHVIGVDVAAEKVEAIKSGFSLTYEPGINELIAENLEAGRIEATTDVEYAVTNSDACLICVGTPSKPNGFVDDRHVVKVARDIIDCRLKLNQTKAIIVRSTCLPTIHKQLQDRLRKAVGDSQPLAYAVHPEYLRAGKGIEDFLNPPKILFGCSDSVAREACDGLYPGMDAKVIHTRPGEAAMEKYASNCFHAVKVTFANEMGMLCKELDVDSRKVMDLMCEDTNLNISPYYLKPGFAFGGSCLPKDLRASISWAQQNMISLPMLEHVLPSNQRQVSRLLGRILQKENVEKICLMGLAFKSDTDDLRESPTVTMAEYLLGKGKTLSIVDPNLQPTELFGANKNYAIRSLPHLEGLMETRDQYDALNEADLIVVSRKFDDVDWTKVKKNKIVFDVYGDTKLEEHFGSRYHGIYW